MKNRLKSLFSKKEEEKTPEPTTELPAVQKDNESKISRMQSFGGKVSTLFTMKEKD